MAHKNSPKARAGTVRSERISGGKPLHQGNESQKLSIQAFEETVNFEWRSHILCINHTKDFARDFMRFQELETPKNLIETGFSIFPEPVNGMKSFRPVEADPDNEILFFQELAPFVVQQSSVGLNAV